MYKGITPTFVLTLPAEGHIFDAEHVYVTLAAKCKTITKSDTELSFDTDAQGNAVIYVFLPQEETLAFPKGQVLIQVNWTYDDDGTIKRACSTIASVTFADNLLDRVI